LLVYRYLSYEKTVDKMPPGWKFWRARYAQIRIVGGYWLRPGAKRVIAADNTTTTKYFAGVAFDEDQYGRALRAR